MKKRAVVICPGRGSYTEKTLGYLRQNGSHVRDFTTYLNRRRAQINEPTVSSLDEEPAFKPSLHTRGEHASLLIYACAYADYMAINRDKYDIVAVAGNSMGWYLTLAVGGVLEWEGGFEIVNTMGSMMKESIVGGQVIYPIADDTWKMSPERLGIVHKVVENQRKREGVEIYDSIYLGGMIVLGANKAGIAGLLKDLPPVETYPFQLINHAAFHTPMLRETSEKAFHKLPQSLFQAPTVPLIDGRGCIWQPYSTDVADLYHYTLGHQVVEPYDFTGSVTVALKEFAPDHVILLGPGSNLGATIAQVMIACDWHGLKSKADFNERQAKDPLLLAMGRQEQRPLVI